MTPGTRLGPYEIVGLLGKGGMGEVYRAHDSRLKRDVAIKISAERFSERFEREALAVAALNHPNVCTLYDVGPNYLVMEYIEGESPKGPLPLEEALRIAGQIADALEAAHEKLIIHRDLKPANIKIRPDGTVKVLDFGLAKVHEPPGEDGDTVPLGKTEEGTILGTPAYMSPEQALGKKADKRADIWAFGVVLYELIAGERLFKGKDMGDILVSVVKDQPDLTRAPVKVQRLLESCLEKDLRKRLQAIGDWRLALDEAPAPPAATAPPPRSRLGWLWPAATALCLLAASALGYVAYRHAIEEPPHAIRFTAPPPEKGVLDTNALPAISPDGRRLAFVAVVDGKRGLWVRDLDALSARLLLTEDVRYPFWSPDSGSIAFFSNGQLKRIDASGGPALTLCSLAGAIGFGGTWNRNDVILFGPGSKPIFRVAAGGGNPIAVTTLDQPSGELRHTFPWFLPDGRHFLYTAWSSDSEKTGIYVGDLASKERRRVMYARSNAVYAPPGSLLFLRERTLMAQPFDAGKLETTGDAFPVAEQVDSTLRADVGEFSVSGNGVLAYTSGGAVGEVQLTWLDRSGKRLGTIGDPGYMQWAALSPDGATVAFDRRDPQTGYFDIWLHDLARGTDSRFTFNSRDNQFPVWSPDGSHIAFNSDRAGNYGVYQKAIGGVVQESVLHKDGLLRRPVDWSADGRYVFDETSVATSKTNDDIWVVPVSGDPKPYAYLQTEFRESSAKLSPNGQWLAYSSDESKRSEIYIATFPNPARKWQISTNGGEFPVWSRDGKELFYVDGNGKIMAAGISGSGGKLEAGVPKALFDVRLGNSPRFDVAKDGKFLVPLLVEQNASTPITVVVNWPAGLKK